MQSCFTCLTLHNLHELEFEHHMTKWLTGAARKAVDRKSQRKAKSRSLIRARDDYKTPVSNVGDSSVIRISPSMFHFLYYITRGNDS